MRLESAWRIWRTGENPPRWERFLPTPDEPCSPDLIFLLVQIDIGFRAKAGLSALLTERYFEHPRLRQDDARLDAARQIELIRWEYQQRWQNSERARRGDYESAFPQHASALSDLKPRSHCPQCGREIDLEETAQTLRCPLCGTESALTLVSSPFVAPIAPLAETPAGLDLRGYELIEPLGAGGMGEVYRACDPALGRDLAVKVMKPQRHNSTGAERRFLREARVTGSLQHPGIVPVHNLGRLTDGRLHYTMRLVRGRTFADILKDEAGKPERLPHLLAIFEKVCQAVAYAHSKKVIHRDLKPANIMVGRFGEVQVMDWGLAKLLTLDDGPAAPEPAGEVGGTLIHTEPTDTPLDLSRTGAGLGTPAYMPPEQALGEWDAVDERADVFALGSILCEILTRQPAYNDQDGNAVLRQSRRGDLAEALARLEQCGADPTLTALCRECLTPAREGRPRDAGVVADRVAAYQAEVQERLRRAELERTEAQVKAREERKRRRLAVILAAVVVLLVVGGVAGFWWQQWQREQVDQAVVNGLAQAELLAEQARAAPLEPDKYHQALEAARVAAQLAAGASADSSRRAEELVARLEQEEKAAKKDRELLAALLDVRGPREGRTYISDDKGGMMVLVEPTADEQFVAAFQRWGLDVDDRPTSEAAALLKGRPPMVVTEVIVALDEWASERRQQGKPKADWQRLADLASRLDDDPGSKRRELREILARGQLPVERALGALSVALRPVPIPVEVPLGEDRRRLRQLAEQTDPAAEPILGLLTLVRALGVTGEEARAEQLLRAAIVARPREVVLHHTLGQILTAQKPPRWAEAVECYGAARVSRPDLGVNLATALLRSGRDREGLALLARLVTETPKNPFLHFARGNALHAKRRLDEAMAEYRQAIALDPKDAPAHHNLGHILYDKRQLNEAMAEFRQAIRLKPDYVEAHFYLGFVLQEQGRFEESLACLTRGHDLGSKQPGRRYPSAQWVRNAERLLMLDKKLPAILTGEATPANPGEAVVLASMCQQPYKKRYAASARLYADAFAAEPKLAQQHRYNAACSAALAAASQGEDARLLPDKVAGMFRYWALGWLHDDLTVKTKFAGQIKTKVAGQNNRAAELAIHVVKSGIQQQLTHWRSDPDLASLRDPAALDRLPDNERAAWQALWRDVDELAKRMTN